MIWYNCSDSFTTDNCTIACATLILTDDSIYATSAFENNSANLSLCADASVNVCSAQIQSAIEKYKLISKILED